MSLALPRPGRGTSWIVENLQTDDGTALLESGVDVPRPLLISPVSEYPAKIVGSNPYGQTWIRITCIFINDMRTISAQIIDSKQS